MVLPIDSSFPRPKLGLDRLDDEVDVWIVEAYTFLFALNVDPWGLRKG